MGAKKALIVGVFALSSQSAVAYFDTGNDLLNQCRKDLNFSQGACHGMISGAYDMMTAWGFKCQDKGVSRQQIRDVVVQYLESNPATRHQPAAFLIVTAVEKAFSCKRPGGL